MNSSQEQLRATFQSELDTLLGGATLQLLPHSFPRELPGPVVVRRAITLDGQGAMIWAKKGPVMTIEPGGVTLRNIKIEVTEESGAGGTFENCAILFRSGQGVALEQVEVRGTVIGLPEEEGEWYYPRSLPIPQLVGQLAHSVEHELTVRVAVPVPCQIQSDISGLSVEPRSLHPGLNDLRLHIEGLPQGTSLNGSLSLSTAFLKRRIMLSVHVLSSQAEQMTPSVRGIGQVIWEPQDGLPSVTRSMPEDPLLEVVSVPPVQPPATSTSGETGLPIYPKSVKPQQTQPTSTPVPSTPRRITSKPVSDFFVQEPSESHTEERPEAPEQKRTAPGDAFQERSASPERATEAAQHREPSHVSLPSRRVKSQGLSPLFGQKSSESHTSDLTDEPEANESALGGVSQERSPTGLFQQSVPERPSSSRRVKSQGLSPLFGGSPSESPTQAQTDEPKSKRSAEDSAPQTVSLHQTPNAGSSSQTLLSRDSSSSDHTRSVPLGPAFGQKQTESHTEDQTDEPEKDATALGGASQERSKQRKRKIVRPGGISPLFEENTKKGKSDDET